MRIVHLSDTHGNLPRLPLDGVDAVIHSGDFLPNKTRGNLDIEPAYQQEWLERYAPLLLQWMPPPMPFLFCRGNHDFMNPVGSLRAIGINAIDITSKFVKVGPENCRNCGMIVDQDYPMNTTGNYSCDRKNVPHIWEGGISLFGFPYVPWFSGEWWGELSTREMGSAMEGLLLILEREMPDILVSHGPMHGILDRAYGEHCGSKDMLNLLKRVSNHLPKIFLCGHIHESHGKDVLASVRHESQVMRVFNSATTFQVIEI